MKQINFFLIVVISTSIAYGGEREDFERYCLVCHGVSAPKIYPADRVKKDWKEFFKEEFRKAHSKEKVKIPPKVLRRIERYVETYSADSDQPEGATF